MKSLQYIVIALLGICTLVSCEKNRTTPAGVVELEHHYYAIFVPNTNTGVTVARTQTALLKFPSIQPLYGIMMLWPNML